MELKYFIKKTPQNTALESCQFLIFWETASFCINNKDNSMLLALARKKENLQLKYLNDT